jgi:Transposase, Mutator family
MMDAVGAGRGASEAPGLGSDQPVTAREAVDKMVQAGMLDDLMNQVDSGDLQLTGEGGFLPELVKRVLEAGLQAELTDHLGYERHDRSGHGSGNSRNGFTAKRLGTEVGDMDLATPRDRLGSFEPRLVPKGQRRVGGLSEMIISLYAGGMTIRDIQAHLERTLGTELSHETISNITDAVLEQVKAWQARPLEAVYPIVYLDALVVKVKESHQVRNKAAHLAVGVDVDGIKHVLGIWVQTTEGAKFWAGVLAELRNRGVANVLIACCDGLTGFPEAIEATWPNTVVQTSSVHYGVAGGSRWSLAPSRSGPVQTCCLRGPDADLSGWGGGGPCISQREQRQLSAEMRFRRGRPNAVWRGPKEASWCQIKINPIIVSRKAIGCSPAWIGEGRSTSSAC